ncbi:cupin domain-containing protein, partial [Undibacterium sp. CCC2.1]
MTDPLTEVVTLLQPQAAFSKVVSGAGPWRVRRSEDGQPFYSVILNGSCHLAVDGHAMIN